MRIFVTFFTSIFLFYNSSFAASISGNTVGVTISPAINVSKSSDLNFGIISVNSSSGTVNQDGLATGGVEVINSDNMTSAVFDVSGLGNTSYNFTIPDEVTLTDGSSNKMVADLSFSNGNSSRTLTQDGKDSVEVNGILNVSANQVIGNYSGTYNINVAY